MAVLENAIDIARSPLEVFDYCSDLCNEREWSPGYVKDVQRLTDGPIGVGTRYRAEWQQGGPNTIEYTRFERPTSWEATADSKTLGMVFQGRVEPTPAGSRLIIRMDLRPHGLARLATPILGRVMQAQEIRNLAAIKRTLEAKSTSADPKG
jgi:Polyketide cyclase / dehydrase and lipid transport